MQKFKLYWRTGEMEEVEGRDIADAMRGYSPGALPALDFWDRDDGPEYHWEEAPREWVRGGICT